MLTELRALADAVLLGTGTVRAEGYARLVAHPDRVARRRAAGLADTPLAVLISRGFDFPWDAQLFTAADQPVLLYAGAPGDVPPEVAAPGRGRPPRRALALRGAWPTSAPGASARCCARAARRSTARCSPPGSWTSSS